MAISHILSVNLSRFNVGTGHGQKREWEVGNKSTYDVFDTRMSMKRSEASGITAKNFALSMKKTE